MPLWANSWPGSSAGIWCWNISPPLPRWRWAGRAISTISCSHIGMPIPAMFNGAPIAMQSLNAFTLTGSIINLPAVLLVGFISTILVIGVTASANFNNAMVAIKLTIVLVVIFACYSYIVPANHHALRAAQPGRRRAFRLDRRLPRHRRAVLLLYRLRRGQRRGPGSQEPAARYSARHAGLADHLHRALHDDVLCADRHRAITPP